ncbi:MAG: glucosaminidase domain-containing protein [Campylobacterota bacterium]|nr:glucosaminidase domain-containing protein [Campylobacterota bacterium]
MITSMRYLVFIAILFFTGCDKSKVVILDENLIDTKVGTVEDKKFITEVKKKEVIKQNIPKQDLKKYGSYKKLNNKTLRKKEQFVQVLAPVVITVYKDLEKKYNRLKDDVKNNRNLEEIERLKKEYKAKNNIQLLHALKPHPVSIVLAQSAIESAWLTSRFAKEANNIFGVWSFKKDEPRIAASGLRGDKTIYLKKYSNLKESVEDYYKSIAKSWAYKELRFLRTATSDPYILLPYFRMYSEKRDAYVAILEKVLKHNKFYKYDIKD